VETLTDLDLDGIPNYLDLDSDGDGLLDVNEGNVDLDADGQPAYLDFDDADNTITSPSQGAVQVGCSVLLR